MYYAQLLDWLRSYLSEEMLACLYMNFSFLIHRTTTVQIVRSALLQYL